MSTLHFATEYVGGYTLGMKTAISLPDEVFTQAERLAKRRKLSRSERYARAVSEYLSRHAPDAVTEALDTVCDEVQPEPKPAYRAASRKILEATEW